MRKMILKCFPRKYANTADLRGPIFKGDGSKPLKETRIKWRFSSMFLQCTCQCFLHYLYFILDLAF